MINDLENIIIYDIFDILKLISIMLEFLENIFEVMLL